ncbi:hypothetical protein [Urbifossiella limnaea]|uniref:Tetratricopeptide repeat protein n=1 Tax=Urbifossiella limnaea TaxID=2528023 RepID=A0A517XMF5_9BACT|nr:hypothetical protein [Urbifossiella limnaea]QDU18672.1 hypothetical protein ETAA1_05650 [Urbifossiella limnaea]
MTRRLPIAAGLFAAAVAVAAGQPADDLVRRANAVMLAGDPAAADPLYAAAAERTADPGLVAYNTAAVRAAQGRFYDAEVLYARALDDRDCPPTRAARAWYNRGVCLLKRGGDAAVYRSAVACLERCRESPGADDPLKADARRLIELAKLLWAEAARKAPRPESPNAPTPEDLQQPPPPQTAGSEPETRHDQAGKDGSTDTSNTKQTKPAGVQPTQEPGSKSEQPTAGVGPQLRPLANDDTARPLSPEETRAYLRQTEERLRKERQGLLRAVAGADRPGVKDW